MGYKATERLDYYFYSWEVIDKSIVPYNFVYIGSTADMKSRKYNHKLCCFNNKATEPLYLCMRKYGYDKFNMMEIGREKQLTKKEARIKEQEYIDKLRSSSESCIYRNFNEAEYKPNTIVILNAISAYNGAFKTKLDAMRAYALSVNITDSYIANEEYKQEIEDKKIAEGTDYNNIMDVINNSKIHELEYKQKNTGELHKIKFYGLLSSKSTALRLYFMKRNFEKTYMDDADDNNNDFSPSTEAIETYEYNCPMIRTELFDNRDKKMVIKYLKQLVNDMETE